MTLNGGNSISEVYKAVNAVHGGTRTVTDSGKIGSPISAAVSWNVHDANTLIRTQIQPQSLLTIRATVGVSNSCSAQISYDFKPGFSEYKLRSLSHPGGFTYLSSISVETVSCKSNVNQSNISEYVAEKAGTESSQQRVAPDSTDSAAAKEAPVTDHPPALPSRQASRTPDCEPGPLLYAKQSGLCQSATTGRNRLTLPRCCQHGQEGMIFATLALR